MAGGNWCTDQVWLDSLTHNLFSLIKQQHRHYLQSSTSRSRNLGTSKHQRSLYSSPDVTLQQHTGKRNTTVSSETSLSNVLVSQAWQHTPLMPALERQRPAYLKSEARLVWDSQDNTEKLLGWGVGGGLLDSFTKLGPEASPQAR